MPTLNIIQVEVEEATPRPETESLYDLPSNVLPRDHHHKARDVTQSRDMSPFVRGSRPDMLYDDDGLSSSIVELVGLVQLLLGHLARPWPLVFSL